MSDTPIYGDERYRRDRAARAARAARTWRLPERTSTPAKPMLAPTPAPVLAPAPAPAPAPAAPVGVSEHDVQWVVDRLAGTKQILSEPGASAPRASTPRVTAPPRRPYIAQQDPVDVRASEQLAVAHGCRSADGISSASIGRDWLEAIEGFEVVYNGAVERIEQGQRICSGHPIHRVAPDRFRPSGLRRGDPTNAAKVTDVPFKVLSADRLIREGGRDAA